MIVSRETKDRLSIYGDLLGRWNSKINLVSPATLPYLQERHFDDCLQVSEIAGGTTGLWVDLGSGGGLPGLVLAISNSDTDMKFKLVESDKRKAAFLRTVVRETALTNVTIVNERIEALSPQNAAYVSARALAPLRQLMAYLALHLAPSGRAFLMKGVLWRQEVQDARKNWNFDYIAHPSRTEAGAAILEVTGVRHGGA